MQAAFKFLQMEQKQVQKVTAEEQQAKTKKKKQ